MNSNFSICPIYLFCQAFFCYENWRLSWTENLARNNCLNKPDYPSIFIDVLALFIFSPDGLLLLVDVFSKHDWIPFAARWPLA
jgi:hypothetical protein